MGTPQSFGFCILPEPEEYEHQQGTNLDEKFKLKHTENTKFQLILAIYILKT